MSTGSLTDRRFIFFASILIIIGIEMFALRFYLNNDPNYGQKLINAEVENYVKIAEIENTDRLHGAIESVKDFVYGAVKGNEELFNTLMNSVGVPVIAGIIRALTLMYAIPLLIIGFILGVAEGHIAHNKKIEQFKFKSVLMFHWTHRYSIFFFVCVLIGYLICPVPANPYLVIYGYGLLAYLLAYYSFSNLPMGNL